MVKKVSSIFVFAFALNWVWENLHSALYASYKGGPITEWILARATFWDAVMITALSLVFIYLPYFKNRRWWMLIFGSILGAGIEIWALHTGRWAYNAHMPIIPILNIGLTPTIQLALTGFAALELCKNVNSVQAQA